MGKWRNYPLVIEHSCGKSPFLNGEIHCKWQFSMVMLNYQRFRDGNLTLLEGFSASSGEMRMVENLFGSPTFFGGFQVPAKIGCWLRIVQLMAHARMSDGWDYSWYDLRGGCMNLWTLNTWGKSWDSSRIHRIHLTLDLSSYPAISYHTCVRYHEKNIISPWDSTELPGVSNPLIINLNGPIAGKSLRSFTGGHTFINPHSHHGFWRNPMNKSWAIPEMCDVKQ